MAFFVNRVDYVNEGGQVFRTDSPDCYDFLYEASTVKDSHRTIGDRVVLPDGRTFRYAYASGTCNPEVGAYKSKKTNTNAVAPAQATAATANDGTGLAAGVVGSRSVSVTIDTEIGVLTTGVLSANELAGGYVVIGNGTSQHPQMRRIVAHPALTTAGGTLCLRLDAKLVTAVTVGTTNIELMENPFYCVIGDNAGGDYVTFLGVSARVLTAGQYGWIQTKGIAWITSDGNTCDSAGDRTLVWLANGSIVSSNDITVESGIRIAGVAMDNGSNGASNAPFVNLNSID
jgi:hypothetical protein